MISAKQLDKIKRKLRRTYLEGSGPVSISVNSIMEVFLWVARPEDPLFLSYNVTTANVVYVAYESKIWEPTDNQLMVELELDEEDIFFDLQRGGSEKNWKKHFRGIYVRAVEHGELPCEDVASCCLSVGRSLRDFRIIGKIRSSGGHHFEPVRLTLEAK
jgi:hypothetical protein